MASARAGHAVTLLSDGRVLITGGYNGAYLRSCEIFDPATGRLAPAGEMAVPRSGHGAVLLRNGKVLLVGGIGTGWRFLGTLWAMGAPSGDGATTLTDALGVHLGDDGGCGVQPR